MGSGQANHKWIKHILQKQLCYAEKSNVCMVQKARGIFYILKLARRVFFGGVISIWGRKGPFCMALLGPQRDPFVRQNVKSGS